MKMGRPPKEEADKKGAQLSVRIPLALRNALEAASHLNCKTLSQEIEYRLRSSFSETQGPNDKILEMRRRYEEATFRKKDREILSEAMAEQT